jgi:acyl-CoA dehydrogenase
MGDDATMDFTIEKPLAELRDKVSAFVREKIIPFEKDPRWAHHGIPEDMRHDLNKAAKEAGLLGVNSPEEFGGKGFSHFEQAVVFEAAGYSILGPIALHFHAPDEGNIHLLDVVATPAQRQKYLKRLATGEVRSCFAMTEPDGGAGADPLLLKTRATPDGNGFVISGRKTLITGAEGAAFAIIMARTGDGPTDCTMFMTELPNPAFKISRVLNSPRCGSLQPA